MRKIKRSCEGNENNISIIWDKIQQHRQCSKDEEILHIKKKMFSLHNTHYIVFQIVSDFKSAINFALEIILSSSFSLFVFPSIHE